MRRKVGRGTQSGQRCTNHHQLDSACDSRRNRICSKRSCSRQGTRNKEQGTVARKCIRGREKVSRVFHIYHASVTRPILLPHTHMHAHACTHAHKHTQNHPDLQPYKQISRNTLQLPAGAQGQGRSNHQRHQHHLLLLSSGVASKAAEPVVKAHILKSALNSGFL